VVASVLFFNLALSIKGGTLLWLPGYLLMLAKVRGILCPIFFFIFTGVFQFLIAIPFLMVNSQAYLNAFLGLDRRIELRHTILYSQILSEERFF
jgi:uncharacterized membrane protein